MTGGIKLCVILNTGLSTQRLLYEMLHLVSYTHKPKSPTKPQSTGRHQTLRQFCQILFTSPAAKNDSFKTKYAVDGFGGLFLKSVFITNKLSIQKDVSLYEATKSGNRRN